MGGRIEIGDGVEYVYGDISYGDKCKRIADRAVDRATYFRPRASKSLYLSREMVGMVATRFDAD